MIFYVNQFDFSVYFRGWRNIDVRSASPKITTALPPCCILAHFMLQKLHRWLPRSAPRLNYLYQSNPDSPTLCILATDWIHCTTLYNTHPIIRIITPSKQICWPYQMIISVSNANFNWNPFLYYVLILLSTLVINNIFFGYFFAAKCRLRLGVSTVRVCHALLHVIYILRCISKGKEMRKETLRCTDVMVYLFNNLFPADCCAKDDGVKLSRYCGASRTCSTTRAAMGSAA